jgi:hypothetical protein
MPIENDFTRVFGAIKELEDRVERMEQSVWSGGETVSKFEWKPWEHDYKALFESEQLNAGRLLKELNSEVIKREEVESVKLYFAALADRYELSAAEKTEQIEQLKALNEEHLKTIAELVAALAPTGKQEAVGSKPAIVHEGAEPWSWEYECEQRGAELQRAVTQNNQLRFILSILAAVKDEGWIEWHGGECPVGRDVRVEIETGIGFEGPDEARYFFWHNNGRPNAIIAYRIAR